VECAVTALALTKGLVAAHQLLACQTQEEKVPQADKGHHNIKYISSLKKHIFHRPALHALAISLVGLHLKVCGGKSPFG
jgi:hypothetical protein